MIMLPNAMKKIAKHLPYQERLRNYEYEKQALLSAMRDLPAGEFSERLKELQEKWDV